MSALGALPDLCSIVTDGTHDSPKLQPAGVPFIKGKHISGGRVDFSSCDYITEEDHAACVKRIKPQRGDILFSNIGSIGDTAVVDSDVEFSIKNIALFRPDPRKADPRYVYYLVCSEAFRSGILNQRSGAAQPFISLANLRSFQFAYEPDLPTQRRIAGILSAYDDLIENNLRRIRILEEMAQSLYREWFVHFRFPGHESVQLVDSPLGPIPEGWEVRPVGYFGKVITGKTPSKANADFYGEDVPFVKTPDMHGNMFLIDVKEKLSTEGADSQANKTLPIGSICVSCIGTIGVVCITSEECQTNQQINSIALSDEKHVEFLYFRLLDAKQTLENLGSNGATMGNVNKSKFESMEIFCPPSDLIGRYHGFAAPIFAEILVLTRHNQTLRQTRNLLLPKLLSVKAFTHV